MVLLVSPGERHESRYLPQLMEQGAVRRCGPGRPRLRPDAVVGDRGYSYPPLRRYLRERGIRAVIPYRRDQPGGGPLDRVAYRDRNRVERLMGRLKQFRRIATRYEKRGEHYRAMATLAAITLWL